MEEKAFQTLAVRHLDALYRYALRLARVHEGAEDLVQETYARAIAHRDRVAGPEAVRPMLFRILYRLFVDEWRARQRGPVMISMDAASEGAVMGMLKSSSPDPLANLLRDSLSDEVEAALAELDEPLRSAILLHEIEGLSYEEIAEAMDAPLGTVASRLARARAQLAKSLADHAREHGLAGSSSRPKGANRP